jgi:hypothetical protein
MAAHLKWCGALALLAAPSVFAQTLNDPTRPPGELLGRGPVVAASAPAPVPGYSPVQVVIISKDRHQATIDGQTVKLGGRYGNATVARITEEEIVLQRPEATETIKLYSSIQRTKYRTASRERSDGPGRREEKKHEAK